eukprot:629558-Prorocentrum_lima.AAC.1
MGLDVPTYRESGLEITVGNQMINVVESTSGIRLPKETVLGQGAAPGTQPHPKYPLHQRPVDQ